jgi:hypothetical protein
MKFINRTEIKSGDVIAFAFDTMKVENEKVKKGPPNLIYYEVDKVQNLKSPCSSDGIVIVSGKSFCANGQRYKNVIRDWDLIPPDRSILLISRKNQ